MGKDPAVLFYTSDFLSGVMLMSMKERGQFITLLCLQRERGHLSEKDMKKAVGTLSDELRKKFVADENGLFYNPRMESEIRKRQAHAQKQRENVMRRWHPEGKAGEETGPPTSLLAAQPLRSDAKNVPPAHFLNAPTLSVSSADSSPIGRAKNGSAANLQDAEALGAVGREQLIYKDVSSASAQDTSSLTDQNLKNQTQSSPSPRGQNGNTTVLPFGNGNGRGNESEIGFEEFWKEYPKKVAKQEAEKCWRKLRPDAELREKILLALRAQKQSRQWTRDGGEFIPHPATWLHQRRFEDELTSASAATPSVSGDKFRDAGGEDYAARLQRMIDKYKED